MPNALTTLTSDDFLRWLCDGLTLADQRRLLLALTLDAELILRPQNHQGRTGVRKLHLSNNTDQVLVISVQLESEGSTAFDALKAALRDGALIVQPALWHNPAWAGEKIRRGAVCLSRGQTLATLTAGETAVAFTIVQPCFDRIGTVSDLIDAARRGARSEAGQPAGLHNGSSSC